MKHARQTIREAVGTALAGITGVTLHTSRVYNHLSLPAIAIYCDSERSDSENDTIGAVRRYSRFLQLQIEITVQAISGIDNTVDDYAAQVEAAIEADGTLGGVAVETRLSGTRIEMDGEAEKPTAVATLDYAVWYRTLGTDAETPL